MSSIAHRRARTSAHTCAPIAPSFFFDSTLSVSRLPLVCSTCAARARAAQAAARGRSARAQAAYHAGVAGLAHMQRRDPLEVRERGAEDSDLDRRR